MGFALSWLAVKGKPSETVLADLDLRATENTGIEGESPAVGTMTPSGWYLIVLDEAEHRYLGHEVLARLSRGCEVLTCTVEEHVMFSEAAGWRDGVEQWRVTHKGDEGPRGLDARGRLPAEFAGIRDEFTARQEAEDGAEAEVDYLFEIPVALVEAFTGYRHDAADDELTFEVLESTGSASSTKRSWLGRLLGR